MSVTTNFPCGFPVSTDPPRGDLPSAQVCLEMGSNSIKEATRPNGGSYPIKTYPLDHAFRLATEDVRGSRVQGGKNRCRQLGLSRPKTWRRRRFAKADQNRKNGTLGLQVCIRGKHHFFLSRETHSGRGCCTEAHWRLRKLLQRGVIACEMKR